MYKNYNFGVVFPYMERLADGEINSVPVDGFPVSDKSFYKDDGFPSSTIGLLDRFSREHVDKDVIDLVASRLEYIRAEPSNNKSDNELIKELKPSWVQTAAEYATYELLLQQSLDNMTKTDDVQLDDVDVSVDSVSETKSE